MKTWKKIMIGGMGALTPIILNLLVIELEIIFADVRLFTVLGYLIRVVTLFYLGGVVAFLHKDENNSVKIFELGIVAPALITAMLNAGHIDVGNVQPAGNETNIGSISFISSAYAAPLQVDSTNSNEKSKAELIKSGKVKVFSLANESSVKQFWRGLTGSSQKNIWFVIAGSHLKYEDAKKQADNISKNNKDLKTEIFAPFGGNPYYAVVIGSNLVYREALVLKGKAIRKGLPKDTYLWRLPK